MNDQRQEDVLNDCIERLQAGESLEQCLARHAADEAWLAPMLHAAAPLQKLRPLALSDAQRNQGRASLRAALCVQAQSAARMPAPTPWWRRLAVPSLPRLAPIPAAVALALFVLVGGVAASSQPGGVSYPIRVAVERAPIWFALSAQDRAAAELRVADRRLDDLRRYLVATGKIEPDAVAAILHADQAAARLAWDIPATGQTAIAAHVRAHGDALAALAAGPGSAQDRAVLGAAAGNALAIAATIEGVTPPGVAPTAAPAGPTMTPARWGPSATATPPVGTATARPETPIQHRYGTGTPAQTPWTTASPGQRSQPSQTPHGSFTPQGSATPNQTAKPQATPTARATDNAEPRGTPQPAETPRSTQTPLHTSTPGATGTPQPVETPRATLSPRATNTRQATMTPAPTGTPHTTSTPRATSTSRSTRTPGSYLPPSATPQPSPPQVRTRTPGTGGSQETVQ